MARLKRTQSYTSQQYRIMAVSSIFVLMGFFIGARLYFLQVLHHDRYEALASGQHEIFEQLIPHRGEIYAQTENGLYPLVINQDVYTVYAVPAEIADPEIVADVLLPWYLDIKAREQARLVDEEEEVELVVAEVEVAQGDSENKEEELTEEEKTRIALVATLSKENDPYEPLLKNVDKRDILALEAQDPEGINWVATPARYYPERTIGSHTLGFYSSLSDEKQGQYGLEGFWDQLLSGSAGAVKSEKDAAGSQIAIAPQILDKASDGVDLVLTIDPAIQFMACTKLNEYVEAFAAKGGAVVILEPNSGKVLALCGSPDYDPNHYNEVASIEVYAHPAVAYSYEPGSIFKPITMAAGLDTKAVTPESTYYDEGEYKIAGFTIKNSDLESHGEQNMTYVLEESLNTGMIHVAEEVGSRVFAKYVEAFGFGEPTGIGLSGELAGNISSLSKKGFIYSATASFGQGITVTPLQIAAAYVPVANGGTLYTPYIVEKLLFSNGEEELFQPKEVRDVISPQTSAVLAGMMVSVIKNGHGGKAGVDGFLVAGKTGTAQVAGSDGAYSNETIQSFIGFAPVDEPRFVMLTKLDAPVTRFSSDSAAPLFGEIADFILKYYHVPPTEF